MATRLKITEKTTLSEIQKAYPWITDELIKKDARFKKLKSPAGKILAKVATVAMASKKSGMSVEQLKGMLDDLIKKHEG